MQEYYFDDIKDAGFNIVRIPVTWEKHTQTSTPYEINSEWIDRVEQVVDWGLNRGLYIILNCMHEGGIKEKADSPTECARFDSTWSQIAVRFKDKSEKLFFEILNEPNPMAQSNIDELNKRILGIIRKTNPTRIVVFSGNGYTSINELKKAQIPSISDKFIIGNFHSYSPWSFISEGGTWGSVSEVAALKAEYVEASNWANSNNIPVMVNECGVTDKSEYNSRMFYLENVVENALNNNVPFCYWDDGGMFQTYLREQRKWNDNKDILIYGCKESPTHLKLSSLLDTNIILTWTNRTTLNDSITIEKRTNGTEFMQIARVAPEIVQFKDSALSYGEVYYYRLRTSINDSIVLYSYPQMLRIRAKDRSSFLGQPVNIPNTIEAENYDKGGEDFTFHDTEDANKGGAYRLEEGVDIESLSKGGYQVAYIEKGEWLEYSISVEDSCLYQIESLVASMDGGGKFMFEFFNEENSFSSNTLIAPKTGSWQKSETISTKIEIPSGEYIMRVNTLSTPAFNLDKFIFSKVSSTGGKKISELNLLIAPNPSTSYIDILGLELNNSKVEIIDISGKPVCQNKLSNKRLDISMLNPGIYFVKIASASKTYLAKIIKE